MLSGGPINGCQLCRSQHNLQRCTRCCFAWYCGSDHQAEHFVKHKPTCIDINESRDRLAAAETKLREHHPGHGNPRAMPADPLNTCVGRFWTWRETREYIELRAKAAFAMKPLNNVASIEAMIDHISEIHRLCRGDYIDIRHALPALLIRLDRDQEAYDFMKWWATTGNDDDYDWGPLDRPFLDIEGADATEAVPEGFVSRRADGFGLGAPVHLAHKTTLLFLKLKMLVDLRGLPAARDAVGSAVPIEIMNKIEAHAICSPVIRERRDVHHEPALGRAIERLEGQVMELIEAVGDSNPYVMRMLLHIDEFDGRGVDSFKPGTEEEAKSTTSTTYEMWARSPLATGLLAEKLVERLHGKEKVLQILEETGEASK